ncbi:MAG: aquaporin [Candidatus Saccharimonadales bacterium]
MAQKAKTSTKAKTTSKTSAKKVTASNVVTSTKVVRPSVGRLASISPQALVAEALGTFGLALAALTAPADQVVLVGLALAILLVGLMSVSGGHFNPAVTFGLWATNKIEAIKVPFYWLAQFIGALGAFMVFGAYNGNGSNLDLSTFAAWDWRIFWVEMLGAGLFLFGLIATLKNVTGILARSFGIGLSLAIGLVIAGGLLTANATREQTAVQGGEIQKVSSTFGAQGAALNPAIALAQTERDVESINKSISGEAGAETSAQKTPSHFTLPVILGSLIGAAVGANLYLILAGLSWRSREL